MCAYAVKAYINNKHPVERRHALLGRRLVLRLRSFRSCSVLLAAGLLFPPDFLCLACQRGNYGASLRPCCEGVGRSLSNCPPELQTSSCISQICSPPKMHDKLLKWSEEPNSRCHPGQHQDSIAAFPAHLPPLIMFQIIIQFSASLRFERDLLTKFESQTTFKVLQHLHTLFWGVWHKQGWNHRHPEGGSPPPVGSTWLRSRWEEMRGGHQSSSTQSIVGHTGIRSPLAMQTNRLKTSTHFKVVF